MNELITARDVDDKWQMYTDGFITLVELREWRTEHGLKGDWTARLITKYNEARNDSN